MLKLPSCLLLVVWVLAEQPLLAQEANRQVVAEASSCLAVKGLDKLPAVRAAVLDWAEEERFAIKPMAGDAFVLESESEEVVVIVHPFANDQLISIASFRKSPGSGPDPALERLEGRLTRNTDISGELLSCDALGHKAGRVHFSP